MKHRFELFSITETPKKGRLETKQKSLDTFTVEPEALLAVQAQKEANNLLFKVVDYETKTQLVYRKERKNYRLTETKYTGKMPKATSTKKQEVSN